MGTLILRNGAEVSSWENGYRPPGSKAGEPPWWSIAVEKPVPPLIQTPVDSQRSTEMVPSVEDVGYGWPLPCLAYRLEFLEWQPTTQGERAALTAAGANPNVPQYGLAARAAKGTIVSNRTTWFGHGPYWPGRVFWTNLMANAVVMCGEIALVGGASG